MDTADSLDSYTAKWRARWPEWGPAMAFVPSRQRGLVAAWFALLQELTDAAWGGEDPAPGLAKLAWWQEELLGWSKGARRHPLGTALQPAPAHWVDLARSLPSLQASRARPGEPTAGDALSAFAEAVAAGEAALFGVANNTRWPDSVPVVASSVLAEQALFHPGTAIEGAGRGTSGLAAARPRRIHAALVRAALDEAVRAPTPGARRSSPLSPGHALLIAWRAARGR